jgi:LysM repeat protein
MTAKQWLLVTAVVILNIIIFGALLEDTSVEPVGTATPAFTPHPTFTPMPLPTATAILMPTDAAPPTLPPAPTPQMHVVQPDETLEDIAAQYGVDPFVLRLLNRMSEEDTIRVGQRIIVPPKE